VASSLKLKFCEIEHGTTERIVQGYGNGDICGLVKAADYLIELSLWPKVIFSETLLGGSTILFPMHQEESSYHMKDLRNTWAS
jgi:hypothetical protein